MLFRLTYLLDLTMPASWFHKVFIEIKIHNHIKALILNDFHKKKCNPPFHIYAKIYSFKSVEMHKNYGFPVFRFFYKN